MSIPGFTAERSMNKMAGFTAEASLYGKGRHYHAAVTGQQTIKGATEWFRGAGVVPAMPTCGACDFACDRCSDCRATGGRRCVTCSLCNSCSGHCGNGGGGDGPLLCCEFLQNPSPGVNCRQCGPTPEPSGGGGEEDTGGGGPAGGGGDGGLPQVGEGKTICNLFGNLFMCPYKDFLTPIGTILRQCYWDDHGRIIHSIPCGP